MNNWQTQTNKWSISRAMPSGEGILHAFHWNSFIRKIVIALVLLSGIAAIIFSLYSSPATRAASTPTAISSTEANTQYTTPTRFDESPKLENQLLGPTNSAGFKVLSPPIGLNTKGEVDFRWEDATDIPFTIQILNNRAEIVHQFAVTGNDYTLKNLPEPGLYYWKLESPRGLLHIGKFIVRR